MMSIERPPKLTDSKSLRSAILTLKEILDIDDPEIPMPRPIPLTPAQRDSFTKKLKRYEEDYEKALTAEGKAMKPPASAAFTFARDDAHSGSASAPGRF